MYSTFILYKNAKNTTQIFSDLYFLLRMYNLLFKATISKLNKKQKAKYKPRIIYAGYKYIFFRGI
jgi:hypothetical protein